ncbi:MAG TPA: hypothetical protein VM580_17855, partial [Labilithrix sp.]|nr:hypothetical protein [Labilithrix sp.]
MCNVELNPLSAEALTEEGATHSEASEISGSSMLRLPRGGYYVRTSLGSIQIGIPPETIKDVMGLALDVPVAYVLPVELFDRRRGISIAEFEFPAYYNYFLLKRRCRLVVRSRDIEERV